jgi:hypothetical protein
MANRMASLASATATAIDSAAKHNLQCRMFTELIQQWAAGEDDSMNAAEIVKSCKMDFCMHKDEIVLGVRDGYFDDCPLPKGRPYPLIFTTYSNMPRAARRFLKQLYSCQTARQHDALIREKKAQNDLEDCVKQLPQFYFQGISLGIAYAHPDSGDTVGTVMYGGLRTILNGHFRAQSGQPCMWYFDFESDMFTDTGERKGRTEAAGVVDRNDEEEEYARNNDIAVINRKRFHAQAFGQVGDAPGKRGVIRVKPYVRSDPEYVLDRDRVFGKFISTARPWETIDLHISRLAV